jgi:prepilin-type N-terminal cleavage/methylation domain-containing protein
MKTRDREVGGFTLIEVMVVVAIIATLVSVGLTSLFKARRTAAEKTCIGNMMQLDSAKQQWAVNENKPVTETPTHTDIIGAELYLKQMPACPSGGSYTIFNVATKPTCNLATTDGHSMP